MDKDRLQYFKNRLLKEKKEIIETMDLMKKADTINSNEEFSQELSFYDNHPSDTASELFDKERGLAFKGNEINILNKIETSLESINEGKYGICKNCGKKINEDRLEFIPYAENCIECQKELNSAVNFNKDKRGFHPKNRSIEEEALLSNWRKYGNDRYSFDREEAYESVSRVNKRDYMQDDLLLDGDEDEEEGFVEKIEKISNQQYKNSIE
ncbi:TraR/DksA C4-type zinc finger protein [Clostridium cochlearium]|uniref:Transcriptional regulator, TraR/DksA family n=1 Tax=Clostridium cochlearium TaxID=1494 RepID=A0ABY0QKK9_CLOCO|nr:TraR/DksA C4-type zinc finger protein [Clostridium cochlearium]MBV1817822.1 TraR/DksA C4-type zinc finger protein [Bacteroidales bacterium MSK.15.36]NSJ91729.1 yteA family sporulation protein [Coprococcus sp. MSK.21.13]MBE6065320.1 yteA family sporulation protein [Clostridium cochlearium]MBU5269019.1 TraR/DksA C4-type zinc finger protein [Clostridium cochlearium]MCG4570696.1 TraR/DksA C4-type zinc finger protein [Clostridium cochlearium]